MLRTSAEYKEWRLAVFTRDKFTCQKCGRRKRDIEAHHIKERCKYPELMFDVDNGLTLCHECHKETDNYGWRQGGIVIDVILQRWEKFTGQKAVKLN